MGWTPATLGTFLATSETRSFGPFAVPPGLEVDVVVVRLEDDRRRAVSDVVTIETR